MATRRATLKYPDLFAYYADLDEHLSNGFCFLPPGTVKGELAGEIKLDINVPVVGRMGPFHAQVVQRAPDGGYGLQLPAFASESAKGLQKLDAAVGAVEAYLERKQASEPSVDTEAVARLEARVAELEALLAKVPGNDLKTRAYQWDDG